MKLEPYVERKHNEEDKKIVTPNSILNRVKVGDRVKVVRGDYNMDKHPIGTIGTITSGPHQLLSQINTKYEWYFKLDVTPASHSGVCEYCLELVKE